MAAGDSREIGRSTIHLLTNHPRKVVGLEAFGIQITKLIPFPASVTPDLGPAMASPP